jgi:hypothetical protein
MTVQTVTELTWSGIDQEIRTLHLDGVKANALLGVQGDRIQRLVVIYRAVRPLLVALAALPLIPSHWRAAVQVLITTLDEIAAPAATGEFKAGKDL